MQLRLFRMGLEGKVAMVNLGLFGAVATAYLIAFPGLINYDTTPKSMLWLASVLEAAAAVLSFPVEWLSRLVDGGMSSAPIAAVIFVPLNAYFWGYLVTALVRRYKPRGMTLPADGDSVRS